MPYYLFWPDSVAVATAGFGKVAEVPAIFNSSWTYEKTASRYLRDRACLTSTDAKLLDEALGSRTVPTVTTLKGIGYALCNFFEWCELRGKRWEDLSYDELLDGYQAEMQRGTWSTSGKGLSPTTVNQRTDHVCTYLKWATNRGLRGAFFVPTVLKKIRLPTYKSSHGHRPKEVESRVGRVREDPMDLRLPTDAEVSRWHKGVAVRFGPTKALLCELILETAVRREEAVQWRIDTLPLDRGDWNVIGDYVQVKIMYGAKGPKYPTENGNRGPGRIVFVPLHLAEKLHHYRAVRRPVQRAKYARLAKDMAERRARSREKTTRLFLSDDTGEPINFWTLYKAWKNDGLLPFAAWAPHLGRHYWSCKTVLKEVRKHLSLLKNGQPAPGDWTTGLAMDALNMIVKPQLGHLSEKTTMGYLVWLRGVLSMVGNQMAYDAELGDLFEYDSLEVPVL